MSAPAPLGLLLDVDGPLASTETRTVPEGIITTLARLAQRRVPIGFNTGRSADFLLHSVIAPLRAAGLPDDAPFYAVCEKGAVWFPFSAVPEGELPEVSVDVPVPNWVRTDPDMAIDPELREAMWAVNEERDEDVMFADRTKLVMVSLEEEVGADDAEFTRVRDEVVAAIEDLLERRGLAEEFEVDPTIISIDVEHASSGKDLGVERCLGLMADDGVAVPERWITAGDSRSDYAMADALHAMGARVEHMDVRPEDGIPEKAYGVLTAADLAERGVGQAEDVHERAGESLLRWAERDLLG